MQSRAYDLQCLQKNLENGSKRLFLLNDDKISLSSMKRLQESDNKGVYVYSLSAFEESKQIRGFIFLS